MANMNFGKNYIQNGLGTVTLTVPSTIASGPPTVSNVVFTARGQVTFPSAIAPGDGAGSNWGGPSYPAITSSLVLTITQNGSTVYTSPTVTPTQSQFEFRTPIVASAGDIINFVFSSANANDATLQAIKANISFEKGI